jgi:hypothetical protein
MPAGSTVVNNVVGSGLLTFTFTSPTPLPSGPVDFVSLPAQVFDFAPYTDKQLIDLSEVLINQGAIPARDDDGVHLIAYFGDASGNGRYSASDAVFALRAAIGLDGGFAGFPLADPALLADVTGNGVVTAADATRLVREVVGIDQPEVPPIPPNAPTFLTRGPDPLLSLPRGLRARRGGAVVVPVRLDVSEGLRTADLALSYDRSRLELVEVRRGSLTGGFDLFAVRHDTQAGSVQVGLGRSTGPVSGRGSGSVLELVFRAKATGRAVVNLRQRVGVTRRRARRRDRSEAEAATLTGRRGCRSFGTARLPPQVEHLLQLFPGPRLPGPRL